MTTKDSNHQKDENLDKPKESSDNKVKYQYSVKLNTSSGNNKNLEAEKIVPEENKAEKVDKQAAEFLLRSGESNGQVLGKVATAKVSAEDIKINQDSVKSKQLLRKLYTEKIKKKAHAGLNTIGANFLSMTDRLVSIVMLRDTGDGTHDDVVQKAKPPILFGIWVMIVTFVVGGGWSLVAPLDSAAGARGFVVVASKKQIIQHRDGGIVESIYVHEGEVVEANQELMKLNDKTIKAQLDGVKAQKEALTKNLELVRTQLESMTSLYEKGFVPRDRLLELQARDAQTIGQIGEIDSRIMVVEEALERAVIRSPVNGTINQLQVNTIGGSIQPGMILMTIVPKEDDLLVEAFINPQDIESIYVGASAKVRISAFKSRTTAPLDGIVTFVSSDVVEPPQNRVSQESHLFQQGMLMYKVIISIDKSQLRKISKYRDLELYPGMVADIQIVTGERTLLQYLLDPITNTFWHAFIEK